jgi:hypothetical protein
MMIRTLSVLFLSVFSLSLLFHACRPKAIGSQNPDKARIDSLENEMRLATEKNPAEPDLKLAMYLAQAYQNFQVKYPDDSISPKYMFKAGQVIENVFDDKARAGEIYFNIFRKYPQSKSAPYALFMTGNLYHTIADTAHAIEMLQFFLAKYPEHELTNDAAALIRSMGGEPDTASRPVKEMPMGPL